MPQLLCLSCHRYLWCHNCPVSSISGTRSATIILSLLSQVPVVPQLPCLFYLRYLQCHNYSVSLITGTCGATTALSLLSQVPVVPKLFCLSCHKYLWCHDCSVSGICFCYLILLYISHVSSCYLSVQSRTPNACRCVYLSLSTISPLRQNHTSTAFVCSPALVTIATATWGSFPRGGHTVRFSI